MRQFQLSRRQDAPKAECPSAQKYGDNPPMLTVTWREPSLVAENHGVFLGGAEMNELCDAEMTYSLDLYNETAADKTVRLILADICDNYCENIIVGEKITVGAGAKGNPKP